MWTSSLWHTVYLPNKQGVCKADSCFSFARVKTLAIAAAASLALASPAMAGTYLNGEVRSAFPGGSYTGSIIETHVGQEFELGDDDGVLYVQAGPAFVVPDEGDSETELSGKIGIQLPVSDQVDAYGEVYAITNGGVDLDQSLDVAVKAGMTYRF